MGNLKDAFSIVTPPNLKLVCRGPKPTCNGVGAACFVPRFIGGDGIVFYFHGKSNQHFSLVSDVNLQPFHWSPPCWKNLGLHMDPGLGSLVWPSHLYTLSHKKLYNEVLL
ncbi:hypothetical protein CK203_083942 [Vitis vinifera]|uniref:Uncharacterized protein n=1 Tax=Vitis vinifera TaxID=29760 RepID=A0A438D1D2_VITVI|nr:hypothetical protein CK203_083942 [Vitis vinifera]